MNHIVRLKRVEQFLHITALTAINCAGKSWTVEWVEEDDLQAGVLKTNWLPPLPDQTMADFPKDQHEAFKRDVVIGTLIATARGAWTATNEWNQLLPDFKFIGLESFLQKVWSRE